MLQQFHSIFSFFIFSLLKKYGIIMHKNLERKMK